MERASLDSVAIPEDPLKDYIDVHQAAVRLGIRSGSVNRLIKKKQLPAINFLGKNFIEESDFEEFSKTYPRRTNGQSGAS